MGSLWGGSLVQSRQLLLAPALDQLAPVLLLLQLLLFTLRVAVTGPAGERAGETCGGRLSSDLALSRDGLIELFA